VRGWAAGGLSTSLRTVTTRVTTVGLPAAALSEVVAPEDRPAFFVVLDLEKNEVSDAEGRTTASDIIMDWVEVKGRRNRAVPRYDYRSRGLQSAAASFLTPP